ncbi:pirin family protein [Mycoplasma sp. P36-A1]|uniref:pirin family protein n=1 Tax=Mycoplasma sp. P36-A1 TaxID=3252900 RepID=UPI003C2E7116
MIKKIEYNNLGRNTQPSWLNSHFHFSFAEYYNPQNINFGALRVVNDDLVQPGRGFTPHPHQNMEIVSYVIEGELSHADSMGNKHTLVRGNVQYMSAGTGVVHSEMNDSDKILRFFQIWILPDADSHTPNYGDYRFTYEDRHNKLLQMVSSKSGDAPIKINQDMNIYNSELDKDNTLSFNIGKDRQAYIVNAEGSIKVNDVVLNHGDAAEIVEENIEIKAEENSLFVILEMAKA